MLRVRIPKLRRSSDNGQGKRLLRLACGAMGRNEKQVCYLTIGKFST
jgi:hypothetical protein